MKSFRKMICALLAVTVLCAAMMPAFADVGFYEGNTTLYLRGETTSRTTYGLSLQGIGEKTKLKSPKSSNKAVLAIYGLRRSSEHQDYYYEKKDPYVYYGASVSVLPLSEGKSTVSVNIDGKTYKKDVTVLNYTNPVKSLVLTGISGKNLKGLFNTSTDGDYKLTKDAKAGLLKVTPANGWKITYVSCSVGDENYSYSCYGGGGAKSATITAPAMGMDSWNSVYVTFRNVATGGTIDVQLLISGR